MYIFTSFTVQIAVATVDIVNIVYIYILYIEDIVNIGDSFTVPIAVATVDIVNIVYVSDTLLQIVTEDIVTLYIFFLWFDNMVYIFVAYTVPIAVTTVDHKLSNWIFSDLFVAAHLAIAILYYKGHYYLALV